jgi:hypothetical protein
MYLDKEDPLYSDYNLFEFTVVNEMKRWVGNIDIIFDFIYPNENAPLKWFDKLFENNYHPIHISNIFKKGYSLYNKKIIRYYSRKRNISDRNYIQKWVNGVEVFGNYKTGKFKKYIEGSDKTSHSLYLKSSPFRN